MDFRETVGRCGLDASGSGQETVAGYFDNCNEIPVSIKGGNFSLCE
jgi:hypothetical protein